MRDADRYRPPFVTEVDEPVHDDCVPATHLMLVAAWTLGEVTDQPQGPLMRKRQMRRLRERMRDHLGPGRQEGGLRESDAVAMVAAEWPDLPPLRTPNLKWDAVFMSLTKGHAIGLWGNPVDVKKPSSPLRRWTENDDYGHCILCLRADPLKGVIFVMDPLGEGRYRGQWVPAWQVKKFAYLDPDETVRTMTTVVIGGASLRK